MCEVILPRLTRRDILEETEGLPKRTSFLVSRLKIRNAGTSPFSLSVIDADVDCSTPRPCRPCRKRPFNPTAVLVLLRPSADATVPSRPTECPPLPIGLGRGASHRIERPILYRAGRPARLMLAKGMGVIGAGLLALVLNERSVKRRETMMAWTWTMQRATGAEVEASL